MPYIKIRGCDYYYTDSGKGVETLLLAHGFLMDGEMFRFQAEAFSSDYRIITFDWRGQGKSEAISSGYDMDELYEDALELIDKLQLKNIHWVGVSMGGFIGMRIAARQPGLLKSLILAETGFEAETLNKKIKWGLLAYTFKYLGPKPITPAIQKVLFGKSSFENPAFKPVLDEYAEKWMKLNRLATFKTAWAIFNRKPVAHELKNISIPTLVVVGDEDVARPVEESKKLAEQIEGVRLEIISRAGHSSPLEQTGAFNRVLENFLENQI